MRQLILYSAISLDNYIAKPNGNVDWLESPEYNLPGEDFGYTNFYKSIDTTIMGNSTYQAILGFDVPFPYPDKTNFVFSRSANYKDTEHVNFITGDIVSYVRELKNKKGKDIWLVGGGQINSLMLNNNLIDKIRLTVIPIILGDGIMLFEGQTNETKLLLESSKSYGNGFEQLTYETK